MEEGETPLDPPMPFNYSCQFNSFVKQLQGDSMTYCNTLALSLLVLVTDAKMGAGSQALSDEELGRKNGILTHTHTHVNASVPEF